MVMIFDHVWWTNFGKVLLSRVCAAFALSFCSRMFRVLSHLFVTDSFVCVEPCIVFSPIFFEIGLRTADGCNEEAYNVIR